MYSCPDHVDQILTDEITASGQQKGPYKFKVWRNTFLDRCDFVGCKNLATWLIEIGR